MTAPSRDTHAPAARHTPRRHPALAIRVASPGARLNPT
jgi:hypothetical protein